LFIFLPVKTTVFKPNSLAVSKAFITLADLPLVEIPQAISPFLPKASICLENILIYEKSLAK